MTTEQRDILFVEDNAHDAELTIRALTKGNVANKVVWVKDGIEALAFLDQRAAHPATLPQVVLLELKLPT